MRNSASLTSIRDSPSGAAVYKLYPAGEEAATLEGWLAVQSAGGVPAAFSGRCITTSAGVVLTLVCNDACLFSAR